MLKEEIFGCNTRELHNFYLASVVAGSTWLQRLHCVARKVQPVCPFCWGLSNVMMVEPKGQLGPRSRKPACLCDRGWSHLIVLPVSSGHVRETGECHAGTADLNPCSATGMPWHLNSLLLDTENRTTLIILSWVKRVKWYEGLCRAKQ